MWFDSWSGILRVVLVGTAAYATLIVILRLSGKRTLAKLNAYDFVVTVAFGSTLATILLSSSVAWAEGVTGLALLAVLQLVVSLATSRVPGARSVVTAHPTYVVRDGRLLEAAVSDLRLTEAEVRQALRAEGHGDLTQIRAVVLETDGSLSVVGSGSGSGTAWALEDVRDVTADRSAKA